jgi:preprotein translocase subunit YajC
MAPSVYRYELRRGDEVVATGRLTQERAIEVGERIVIGGLLGIVREIEPVLSEFEFRLVVQLWREGVDS